MTIEEFNKYIRKQPLQTYIVEIKLKYQHEKEYRYTNEILSVENGCDYVWLNDWHEGEEDVEILNCVALNDIDLSLQWVQTIERSPECGREVFVYLFDDSPYIAWFDDGEWRTEEFIVDKESEPIAWMPLPELYKEEGESE